MWGNRLSGEAYCQFKYKPQDVDMRAVSFVEVWFLRFSKLSQTMPAVVSLLTQLDPRETVLLLVPTVWWQQRDFPVLLHVLLAGNRRWHAYLFLWKLLYADSNLNMVCVALFDPTWVLQQITGYIFHSSITASECACIPLIWNHCSGLEMDFISFPTVLHDFNISSLLIMYSRNGSFFCGVTTSVLGKD